MLFLKKIQFPSWDFYFSAKSLSSRVKSRRFAAWSINFLSVFLRIFVFAFFLSLSLMLPLLLLIAAISLLLLFLTLASNPCIDVCTQSLMIGSHLPHAILDTYSICHLLDVNPCVLSSISLSFGPFIWVPPCFKKVLDSLDKLSFEKFSSSSVVFFSLFFLCVWVMVCTSNFLKYLNFSFFQSSLMLCWFSSDVTFAVSLFYFFIMIMAHCSKPNSISILYILGKYFVGYFVHFQALLSKYSEMISYTFYVNLCLGYIFPPCFNFLDDVLMYIK